MNLPVAGIDLRRTPEGEWHCLEVNPSPAFSYYQAHAGLPISEAIARLLAAGAKDAEMLPAGFVRDEAGAALSLA